MKSKTVQRPASTQEQSDSPVYETVELREQTETVSMSYNVAYGNANWLCKHVILVISISMINIIAHVKMNLLNLTVHSHLYCYSGRILS